MNADALDIIRDYTNDSGNYSKSVLAFTTDSCGTLNYQISEFEKYIPEYLKKSIKLKSIIIRNKNSFEEYDDRKDITVWHLNRSQNNSITVSDYDKKFTNQQCGGYGNKTIDTYVSGDTYMLGSFQSTFSDYGSVKYGKQFWHVQEGSNCCITELKISRNTPTLKISDYTPGFYPWQKEILLPYGIFVDVKKVDTAHTDNFIEDKTSKSRQAGLFKGETLENIEMKISANKNIYEITPSPIKKMYNETDNIFCNIFNESFDIFEEAIKKYYPHRCNHDSLHAMSTLVLSLVLFLLYDKYDSKQRFDCYDIAVLEFVAIFHDSGRQRERKCLDGNDTVENVKLSATNAFEFLTQYNNPLAGRVAKIIMNEVENQNLDENDRIIYNIYKGADSIEIGRLTSYDETKNPLSKEYIPDELMRELKNISEEWIYFFRNEIIQTFENMDLNLLPKLKDTNEYGLSTFVDILYSFNQDFITQEYGLSYYEGINNFCINNPSVDKDLLDEIVNYLISSNSNNSLMKDNREVYTALKKCDDRELYSTTRKLFILLFSNSQPFGIENYFEYHDEKNMISNTIKIIQANCHSRKWRNYLRRVPIWLKRYSPILFTDSEIVSQT